MRATRESPPARSIIARSRSCGQSHTHTHTLFRRTHDTPCTQGVRPVTNLMAPNMHIICIITQLDEHSFLFSSSSDTLDVSGVRFFFLTIQDVIRSHPIVWQFPIIRYAAMSDRNVYVYLYVDIYIFLIVVSIVLT